MSLATLIDTIEPFAKGWQRSTGQKSIIKLIQEAIDDMHDCDNPSLYFVPSDNKGFEPYLKTTAGTYQYEVKNANLSSNMARTLNGASYDYRCRRVLDIFVDVTENEYDLRYLGPSWQYSAVNPYSPRLTEKVEFASIPFDPTPPTELDVAQVTFKEDPGTTTATYFIRMILEPPRLTAETIPLTVPQAFYPGFREYCIGQIQFLVNGKYNEMLERWENYWKPRYRAELSWLPGAAGSQVEPIIM